MSKFLLGCQVNYLPPGCTEQFNFTVTSDYYDKLKSLLEDPETATGWYEMETPHGGTAFIRIEWITDLFLVTPEFAEKREAWDAEVQTAKKLEDL